MKPVRRSWIVNKQTEAKATRKGYQFVLDYAHTAHLVQGMTLDALIAELGDVLDRPALKDMLAAYVTLSRARRADGLLLLRAFSSFLFQQGPPPGPECLMKLLRSRLTEANTESYTEAIMEEEYHRLCLARQEQTATRREHGPEWRCFDCKFSYPAEAFGASSRNTVEVYSLCVASGFWLTCKVCTTAQKLMREQPKVASEVILCGRCGHSRPEAYFDGDKAESMWCNPCVLQRDFRKQKCGTCSRKHPWSAFAQEEQIQFEKGAVSLPTCDACHPGSGQHTCTVCHCCKSRGAFHPHALRNANRPDVCILRCIQCHTCEVCGTVHNDGRFFSTNTRTCWTCISVKCSVCLRERPRSAYTERQLHKGMSEGKLRCQDCQLCDTCGQLRHLFSGDSLRTCTTCSSKTALLACAVCGDPKAHDEIDASIYFNARIHRRTAVCQACVKLGYTVKDTRAFHCRLGCVWGRSLFRKKTCITTLIATLL